MANHKSALKRAKQNTVRNLRNKSVKTGVKNIVKEVRLAVDEQAAETAAVKMHKAKSLIDKASKKGVIHRNTAARKISRLSKLIRTLST